MFYEHPMKRQVLAYADGVKVFVDADDINRFKPTNDKSAILVIFL